MATLQVGDHVSPTAACLQKCYDMGIRAPKAGVVEERDITGRCLVSDAAWHESHFNLVKRPNSAPDYSNVGARTAAGLTEKLLGAAGEAEGPKGEFSEFELLDELRQYIKATYGQHYAKDGVQAFALIAKKPERGLAFALGNVIKYSDRFGSKGGLNRADLLKVAHYSILALHCADKLGTANGQGK